VQVTGATANLPVSDVEAARRFYADYLGLGVEEMNLGWVARYRTEDGRASGAGLVADGGVVFFGEAAERAQGGLEHDGADDDRFDGAGSGSGGGGVGEFPGGEVVGGGGVGVRTSVSIRQPRFRSETRTAARVVMAGAPGLTCQRRASMKTSTSAVAASRSGLGGGSLARRARAWWAMPSMSCQIAAGLGTASAAVSAYWTLAAQRCSTRSGARSSDGVGSARPVS
jgi:catechol 2,3-dioxygenase-like lactoylglutathione lyase family enzyme